MYNTLQMAVGWYASYKIVLLPKKIGSIVLDQLTCLFPNDETSCAWLMLEEQTDLMSLREIGLH